MKKRLFYILLTALLFAAFFGHHYNAYFNGHYHVTNNGLFIFHAHPYALESAGPSAAASHPHTKLELLAFELLLAAMEAMLLFIVAIALFHFVVNFLFPTELKVTSYYYHHFQPQRGPPLLTF
jgi:hypothetical protein